MDNVLKQIRSITGLSQRAFADYLHIPVRNIEQWETDKRKPPAYLLELIEYKVKIEFGQHE